jgi:hypothetical protein
MNGVLRKVDVVMSSLNILRTPLEDTIPALLKGLKKTIYKT